MRCGRCGAAIVEGTPACSICGAPAPAGQAAAPEPDPAAGLRGGTARHAAAQPASPAPYSQLPPTEYSPQAAGAQGSRLPPTEYSPQAARIQGSQLPPTEYSPQAAAAQYGPGAQYGQAGQYGQAPAGDQYGQLPPQAQYAAPPQAQYGQPPAGHNQFGEVPPRPQYGPAPASPYGQPPSQGQYGQPPAGSPYGQPPAAGQYGGAPSRPAFTFAVSRLSVLDWVTGGASLLLFFLLFAPWYSYSFGGGLGVTAVTGSASGLTHFWMWLVLLLCLGIVALMVLQAGYQQLPFSLPLPRERLLLIATGVNALFVLISLLAAPGGYHRDFSAYFGLVVALAAVAPSVMPLIRSRTGGPPGPGIGQPGPGIGQPGPGIGQPGPGIGQPGPGNGQPGPGNGWPPGGGF